MRTSVLCRFSVWDLKLPWLVCAILIYIVWQPDTAGKTPRWPVKGVTHKPFNLAVRWENLKIRDWGCGGYSDIAIDNGNDNDNAHRWPQSNFRFHFVNVASWTRIRPFSPPCRALQFIFLHICPDSSPSLHIHFGGANCARNMRIRVRVLERVVSAQNQFVIKTTMARKA